jgi:nitrilase
MYPPGVLEGEDLHDQPEILCRGGSAIVSPLGSVVAGPLYDREDILVADLDLGEIPRSRFDLDVTGHYARPDVFQLTVNEKPAPSVVFTFEP